MAEATVCSRVAAAAIEPSSAMAMKALRVWMS
jgi:hypothetical protein